MARIAVDIDSTLYDFSTPAREAFTKLADQTGDRSLLRGAYNPWTEWRSPADACGLDTWLQVVNMCHEAGVIERQEPFSGAVETCQALLEEGHDLLYISNRATESAESTRLWLGYHGFLSTDEYPGSSNLLCVTGDKKSYIADCQYLIDDRPKTVVDFIYDFDWEYRLRQQADRIRLMGPAEGTPGYEKWEKIVGVTIDTRYKLDEVDGENDDLRTLLRQDLEALAEASNEAAEAYISKNRRRAFVIAYPYNQALTDIPHLYLAPTWAGLNSYLVSKGVLSQPAYHALGSS